MSKQGPSDATKTIADIRKLSPCYDPAKYLPEDWTGTAADILRVAACPAGDRLWVVLSGGWIDDKTLRLFAADCAEHVLHLFEAEYPDDKRPRGAIEAARAYSRGQVSKEQLVAAGDAAWAAAGDAAWAAAGDAAGDAAWAAAGDAAWAAARAAAGDAAWAAAGDAAWAAARAAAGAAAWAAAGNAENEWQVARLLGYLDE